jgi:hypothetical protein
VNRYNKIAAALVVAPREVLEVRPRSSPPPAEPHDHDDNATRDRAEEDQRWDNSPCTD